MMHDGTYVTATVAIVALFLWSTGPFLLKAGRILFLCPAPLPFGTGFLRTVAPCEAPRCVGA